MRPQNEKGPASDALMSDLFGRVIQDAFVSDNAKCCLMFAVHGDHQRGLLSNGCASLRDAARAEFFDPCEAQWKRNRSHVHARQTRPHERPAYAPGTHRFASQHVIGATLHRQLAFDTFTKAPVRVNGFRRPVMAGSTRVGRPRYRIDNVPCTSQKVGCFHG